MPEQVMDTKSFCIQLAKPQIKLTAPTDPLKSRIYQWKNTINIRPIPFISNLVALITEWMYGDQEKLSNTLREQGYTGTITLISREITWDWDIKPISVKAVHITYTVATTSPPLAAIVPFIPWIVAAVIAVLVAVTILSITSTFEGMAPVESYTPTKEGECAEGYVYDIARNLCVRSKPVFPEIPPLVWGVGAAAALVAALGYAAKRAGRRHAT